MLCRSLAFSFLFLPALAAAAPAGSFEMLPGVVVDRDRPAVYLMSPDQGIDAVDPASGARLWSSHEAARPLLVYGDLLVAQTEPVRAGILGIAFLDRNDGTRRLAVDVPLPKGVTARVGDGPGSRFDAWAAVRQGKVAIGWENVERWTKPVPPGPRDALETRLAGGALIDFPNDPRADPRADSRMKPLTRTAEPPPRPAPPIVRLASDDGAPGERVRAGDVSAALRMVRNPAGPPRLVLQRWEAGTGAPLGEVDLLEGDYHLRLPSADGSHLLESREMTPSDGDGYSFLVFSLATGKLLGKAESPRSHAFFFVFNNLLVSESLPFARRVESKRGDEDGDRDEGDEGDDDAGMVFEPRKLRAVDLASGAVVWERPLRDTAYRGPYPP
jgi:hypothetical protein